MKINDLEKLERAVVLIDDVTDYGVEEIIDLLVGTALDEEDAGELKRFLQ